MAIDLGDVLGGLGGLSPTYDVFDAAGDLYGLYQTATGSNLVAPTTSAPVTTSTGATAMATTLNSGCSSKGTYRVVTTYDAATGQAIKQTCAPKRRRRKRLATASDIRDLSSLKSILGAGENFKMWIATRGR